MNQRKPRSGAAAVELALMISIMFLILFGTIDFSRLFYNAVTVMDAARAGVQYGMQSSAHAADMSGMETAANENAQDLGANVSSTAERFCRCNGGPKNSDCLSLVGGCGEAVEVYILVRAENTFRTLAHVPGIPDTVGMSKGVVFRVQ